MGMKRFSQKIFNLNCITKKIVGEATRESSKIPAKRYRCVSVSAKRLIAAPLYWVVKPKESNTKFISSSTYLKTYR